MFSFCHFSLKMLCLNKKKVFHLFSQDCNPPPSTNYIYRFTILYLCLLLLYSPNRSCNYMCIANWEFIPSVALNNKTFKVYKKYDNILYIITTPRHTQNDLLLLHLLVWYKEGVFAWSFAGWLAHDLSSGHTALWMWQKANDMTLRYTRYGGYCPIPI